MSKNYATIDMSKMDRYRDSPHENNQSVSSNRGDKHSNSQYLTVNNANYMSASRLGLSKVSNSLSRIKKVTVVGNNNEIFFPQ